MAITRLKSRSTGDTIVAADDDAEWDNIIDEVNTHTAHASPHTNHLITTGDTMTGELAINISTTATCLDLDSAATTGDILEVDGNSLTTGSLLDLVSNSSDTSARDLVNITQDHADATDAVCLNLDQDADAPTLTIDSEATTANIIDIEAPVTTTGNIINIDDADSLTTGSMLYLSSNSSSSSSRNLLYIYNENASATSTYPLCVLQNAAAVAAYIDQNANGIGIKIVSDATSFAPLDIASNTLTTGSMINVATNALTTGRLLTLTHNGTDTSSRELLKITNDNTAATGTIPLYIKQDSTGSAFFIDSNGVTGNAIEIDQNSDSASNIYAMKIVSDNAGAGSPGGIDFTGMSAGEFFFAFPTDATDPTGGGGAATGRIAIKDGGGTTRYIPYY